MKKIIVVLISMVCFTSIQASIHIVTNTQDNGIGSLRHTINLASPHDTIRFGSSIASTSSSTILLDSSLIINKPLTIIGKRNGANELIISGEFSHRVFDINCTGNFTIDSLAIVKGKETTFATGGGINFSGDTLKLNFVRFFNNEARIGGAINATNVIVKNGNFLDNLGIIRGSAINSSQSCNIDNTYFINNKAGFSGREGLVLYSLGVFKLENSFIRNTTTTSSSPLSTVFHTGMNTFNNHTDIKNTEFLNNPSRALKIYNSDVFVDSCIFRTNRGGIYVSNASSPVNDIVEITHSDFFNNTENSGIEIEGQKKLFINNNLIKFNGTFMKTSLGGMYINDVDSVYLLNSQIEANVSSYGGGGALITGHVKSIKVQNTRFEGNISDEKAVSAYQYEGGSGIYISTNTSTDLFFNHCFFNGNFSNPNGARTTYKGAMVVEIAGDSIASNLNIDNCTFSKNKSHYSSAIGIDILGATSSGVKAKANLNINHSTFVGNEAKQGYLISCYAGITSANEATIDIKNSTIYDNDSENKLLFAKTSQSPFSINTSQISIASSIIANKDSNNFETDSVISNGYNVLSDSTIENPHSTDRFNIDSTILLLDTLKNNGGLTPTLLPKTGSIVINNGNPSDMSDAQNGSILDSRRDIGACEVGAGVGVKENNLSLADMVLFPNPASNKVTITFNQSLSSATIMLIDIHGKIVLSTSEKNIQKYSFEVSNFPHGIYLLRISDTKYYKTKKLIIQ